MTFSEWLADIESAALWEAVDALSAAKFHNNRLLSRHLGMEMDWFGLIARRAKTFAKGQDIITVASDAASHILRDLSNPASRLSADVAEIQADPDSRNKANRLVALFDQAAGLRARRFSKPFNVHAHDTVQFSSLAPDEKGAFNVATDDRVGDDRDLDSLKRAVLTELQKMAAEARATKQTKMANRLDLALQVAPERMRFAPQMVSLDELKEKFPEIKQAQMYGIIQDIQQALTRVASRLGLHGLTAGIEQRRAAR